MLIKTLELRNFCQHRNLKLDFESGLTAIVGPNGCGKSNVLTALRYAFTGDIVNSGKKEQNICQYANKRSKSFVRVVFDHGDVSVEIVRYLRPTSSKDVLTLDTGETIHGSVKINAFLEDLMGEAYNLLSDIVIVAQGDVFGFLTRTASKRAEFFQNLFKVDRAKNIFNFLTKWLSDNPEKVLAGDLEETKKLLSDAEQSYQVTFAEYQKYRKKIDSDEEMLENKISNIQTQMRDKEVYTSLEEELTKDAETVKKYREDIEILKRAASSINQKLETTLNFLKVNEKAYSDARTKLSSHDSVQQIIKQANSVKVQLDKANKQYVQLKQEYEKSSEPVDLSALEEECQKIHAACSNLEGLLNTLNQLGNSAVCPTCGQSLTTVMKNREGWQIEYAILRAKYDDLLAEYNKKKNKNERRKRLAVDIEYCQKTVNSLKQNFESFSFSEEALSYDVDSLSKTVAEYDRQEKLSNTYRVQLSSNNASVSSKLDTIEELNKRITSNTTRLSKVNKTRRSKEYLEKDLAKLRDQKRRLLDYTSALEKCSWKVNELREAKQFQNKQSQEVDSYNCWRKFVMELRMIFSKDAAPKAYAIKYLKSIESVINGYLEIFEADFRVETNETLSFVATFLDGRVQEAARLSGGQSVVLALAFRLAINFVFADDLGFLALDEPTAYLDEHHISSFAPVLDNLRELTNSREIQLIMVTHEQSLAHLFDNVINLGV